MNKSNIEEQSAQTEADSLTTSENQHVSQPNANTNVVGSLFKSREIKFRAWGRYGDWNEEGDERNWQMIDGDSLCFEDFKPICDLLESKEDEEYFMQYTGLKDKTGKEIYEGDIIQDNVGRYWVIRYDNKFCAFMFYYTKGMHQFQHYERFNKFQRPFEIIGNTFENPKLVETLR